MVFPFAGLFFLFILLTDVVLPYFFSLACPCSGVFGLFLSFLVVFSLWIRCWFTVLVVASLFLVFGFCSGFWMAFLLFLRVCGGWLSGRLCLGLDVGCCESCSRLWCSLWSRFGCYQDCLFGMLYVISVFARSLRGVLIF